MPKNKAGNSPFPSRSKAKIAMVGGGACLCILGIAVLGLYLGQPEQRILGMLGVVVLIAGAVVVYLGFHRGEATISAGPQAQKAAAGANTLLIQPDRLEFTELDQSKIPEDYQWRKCRNDGKFYRLLIEGKEGAVEVGTRKLHEFMLPDTQYRDPREFANNLNIPAHRRLAKRKATLMQHIAPWILVVAILVMGLLFVITAPPPQIG